MPPNGTVMTASRSMLILFSVKYLLDTQVEMLSGNWIFDCELKGSVLYLRMWGRLRCDLLRATRLNELHRKVRKSSTVEREERRSEHGGKRHFTLSSWAGNRQRFLMRCNEAGENQECGLGGNMGGQWSEKEGVVTWCCWHVVTQWGNLGVK